MAEIKFNQLEVDLSKGTSQVVDVTADVKKYLAARGLANKYLWELPAGVDPINGDANILHIGVGPLTGVVGGQIVLSYINCLNNWAGAACSGGSMGRELVDTQYNTGILLRGKAAKPSYLMVYDDKVELRDAADLWGQSVPAANNILVPRLKAETGQHFATLMIGPAGEHLVRYANAVVDNLHSASKWGPGAVMGSKNIKAVAVRGTKGPLYADHNAVWELMKTYAMSPAAMDLKQTWTLYGIEIAAGSYYGPSTGVKNNHTFWDPVCDTYNFLDHVLSYKPWVSGCYSCSGPCYVPYFRNDAKGAVTGKHLYDNTYGLAANLLLTMEQQDYATPYLEVLGMDGEELGGLIAWTMDLYEHGIISKEDLGGIDLTWGNLDAVLQFMKAVAYRQGKAANAIADGFYRAIEVFGEDSRWYTSETHGCAIDTQDMRSMASRGNITRYCCSHMGARKHGDADSPLYEALGMCNFWAGALAGVWGSINKALANYINATCGWNITETDVADYKRRDDYFSRAISTKQGYNPIVDSTVCQRFFEEKPVDKYGVAYGFTKEEFEAAIKKYYVEVRGTNEQGVMFKSELQRLGLDFVIPVLEPMGQLA